MTVVFAWVLGRSGRRVPVARLVIVALVAASGFACSQSAADAGRDRPFTLVVLPDTQRYSEKHPELFFAQTKWIKENRDAENIVFVTHVGDIVQHRSKLRSEWEVADKAMATLDGAVPYGVAPGNHDYDSGDDALRAGVATMFVEYFNPEVRFKGRPYYGGSTPNGLNTYQFFSGGGFDFIIFHLEVEPPDDVLAWAEGVLSRHPERLAIITTHIYLLGKDGIGRQEKRHYRRGGNDGDEMWDKFIRRHPQIFLVLCGHVSATCEYYQISQNDAGGHVVEMLTDYKRRDNGGNAWLRLIRFVPARREIQVRTYSPAIDTYETDPDSQFTLPWEPPNPRAAGGRVMPPRLVSNCH